MSKSTTEIPFISMDYAPKSQPETSDYTESERAAMRAYLQRAEVRLSTLHRVATAFLSGAGLLLLTPIFFKDVVDQIMLILLDNTANQFTALGSGLGWLLTLALFASLLYPFLLSLFIPLYGVYLLLKDIVQFYFTIYLPGLSEEILTPTFSLSGVAFSPDESEAVKLDVMRFQYQPQHMNFLLPFSDKRRGLYFDTIIRETDGGILPPSRDEEQLARLGVLPPNYDAGQVKRFNAALGMARSIERPLIEEVALNEMQLARSGLYLRRLVLRYIKTLLMFIWTMVIAFIMLPFLQKEAASPFIVLSLGYLVWALAVMPIMHQPLRWIYRHREADPEPRHVDPQLMLLENNVHRLCFWAIPSAMLALILAFAAGL